MEALFIVPAMVSPQVNEKLIPALSKMIERNIVLNNASLFRNAAMRKYSNKFLLKSFKENEIPITVISDGIISEDVTLFHDFGKLILSEAKDPFKGLRDSIKGLYFERDRLDEEIQNAIRVGEIKEARALQSQMSMVLRQIADSHSKLGQAKLKIKELEKGGKSPFEIEKEMSEYQRDIEKHIKTIKNMDIGSNLDIEKTRQIEDQRKDRKAEIKDSKKAKSRDLETFDYKHSFSSIDQVENPTGIKFFSQISLEPTILEIPLSVGRPDNLSQKMVKVGVKCVPYVIDDVTSIVTLMRNAKNMGMIERFFKLRFRGFNKRIWFTKRRAINKGTYINPNEAIEVIKYTPNRNELSKSKKLVKHFDSADSAPWSTMVILSSYDLQENNDLVNLVNNYRKLTKYVFGDIIITNETKESAYFCTPRMNHCQEIPFDYLKKVMNLKDVLDYSEAARATAWSKESKAKRSNIRKAISENTNYDLVKSKIEDIIRIV